MCPISIKMREPDRTLACSSCGVMFACRATAGPDDQPCWCATLPPLTTMHPGGDCLCPTCLAAALADEYEAATGQARPAAEATGQ